MTSIWNLYVARFIVLFLAMLELSGCMIPYPSHKIYEGKEFKTDSLSWVIAGKTTRNQIIDKYGAPDIDFVDRNVIAYAWSGQSGGVMLFAPYGFISPIRMRRALLIRFDDDDTVAVFSTIPRQTEIIHYDVRAMSFDAEYDDWRKVIDDWLKQSGQQTGTTGALQ